MCFLSLSLQKSCDSFPQFIGCKSRCAKYRESFYRNEVVDRIKDVQISRLTSNFWRSQKPVYRCDAFLLMSKYCVKRNADPLFPNLLRATRSTTSSCDGIQKCPKEISCTEKWLFGETQESDRVARRLKGSRKKMAMTRMVVFKREGKRLLNRQRMQFWRVRA